MGLIRPLSLGLFIYECVRFLLLTTALALSRSAGAPWLVYVAPNILFPLMALFLWLNTSHYRVYLPLFLAGKCVCVVLFLGWSIAMRQVIMIEGFTLGRSVFYLMPYILEGVLWCGDVFTVAAAFLIIKKTKKTDEAPGLNVDNVPEGMEDK